MSHDAWLNAKGINSIRPPYPEKTSNMCWNSGLFCPSPKCAKFDHIFDAFSSWDGRDELIPFELSQASGDTSIDYPKGVFWRQKNPDYFDPIPLLGGPEKKYFGEKKYFPNNPYIIGDLMRYLQKGNITKGGKWHTLTQYTKCHMTHTWRRYPATAAYGRLLFLVFA